MADLATQHLLPDLLLFADGRRVETPDQWPTRRAELLEAILDFEYGHLPPAPEGMTVSLLHPTGFYPVPGAGLAQYRLSFPDGLGFTVALVTPPGTGPFPLIIDGDACWRFLTDDILALAVRRGYAVAYFNRTELAPDAYHSRRDEGLYAAYPEGDFGALSAWAWGFHRVVDFALGLENIDGDRIAATGHSRGGKTALLAGATDGRIALTAPNNSGCGGAGCYRYPDEGGERLEDLIRMIPYWFSPRLREYAGRVDELPFDQHGVKALVAPRAFLSTEALGDLWASPRGTRLTHEAAKDVYRLLNAESRIGIVFREGGHDHGLRDWEVLLDFADWQFYGKPAVRDFDADPWRNEK
ncbi:MAG: dienelactone hydrolase family protein [Armatimonadota bacterium]